uniref:Putative ficolin/ixoderin n=1 Tax=Ixodes ricinus TaxID=34613 RepID=A0A0K8RF70_IXORI
MFVELLFIPVVAGNVFMESSFRRVPEITERQYGTRKTYMIFDPCNTNKRFTFSATSAASTTGQTFECLLLRLLSSVVRESSWREFGGEEAFEDLQQCLF